MFDHLEILNPIAHFRRCVPKSPHATSDFENGVWQHTKWTALKQPYIQANGRMLWCMIFDCDHDAAFCAAEDALLPPPNLIVLNRDNGRGHLSYFLKSPIPQTEFAHIRPIQYAAKIQRGMVKRLDADWGYAGFITKNPLHTRWRTIEHHTHFYQLGELHDYLHEDNCRPVPRLEISGLGRNCAAFDELRATAYRKVREFKRNGVPKAAFEAWAHSRMDTINAQFAKPLGPAEARGIARSVAKWVWTNFDEAGFRQIQSERGRRGNAKRWQGHESFEKKRPWEALGISRATYYRRLKSSGFP